MGQRLELLHVARPHDGQQTRQSDLTIARIRDRGLDTIKVTGCDRFDNAV